MAKLTDLERYKRDQDRFFAEMEAQQSAKAASSSRRPAQTRKAQGCFTLLCIAIIAGASLVTAAAWAAVGLTR